MSTVKSISAYLDSVAPLDLAEEWDNVGLLVGDRDKQVARLMTCLTVTPASAAEAIGRQADLIVTHHPFPFHPLKRLTADSVPGRLLLELIQADVAVYSSHTAFDSAIQGINRRLADGMHLQHIKPLVATEDDGTVGAGRFGDLQSPASVNDMVERIKRFLSLDGLHVVGALDRQISRVAVACGSAGQFLAAAREHGCDMLITGETSFHTCLDAEATGIALLLPGHFASERFAVELLAGELGRKFSDIEVWASERETDPLRWI